MPVLDELSNHTEATLIPGLRADHLYAESPTVNILDRFAKTIDGPAGDDINITHLLAQGEGRWYSGYDTADRNPQEDTVSHRARWSNYQNDAPIPGTQLENNLGMTTKQVLASNMSLRNFSDAQRRMIFNIAMTKLRSSAIGGQTDKVRSMWGKVLPGDNVARMPESITALFDETGPFHGLGVTALKTFESGRHPWADNPPNTDASTNRHIPQIFHNSGTPRSVAKSVLQGPNDQMAAVIPGFWLGPTHPTLFTSLSSEFDSQIEVPIGTATQRFNVQALQIGNTFYYRDAWAETDRIKHLHVGMPDGTQGSFFPLYWRPADIEDITDLLPSGMFLDLPPSTGEDISFGMDMQIPWYSQEWQRGSSNADAIFAVLQLKYCYVCLYRWKQFEVRDLQA